ncbi:alanine racemase C-terminal domain-containing protein [Microbacterium sp. NPDC059771]|uniref:alanine racemase C-terminal domain-containing protein n=1 Tax=unclassified Microbacterium TaxID=2609290 RepID=UPI0036648125
MIDLRRDAWGHGLTWVAGIAHDAGIRHAIFDASAGRSAARSGLTPCDEPATIDSARLFGWPGADTEPVMRVAGRVLSTKELRAGEGVSYNHTHHAGTDTRVALVTGGFGHGIPRALGNEADVEIRGRLFPIIGRVAMDVCVVDIGHAPIRHGEEVVYFGGPGPARHALADWTRITGWTAAELVCALGLRAAREETP